MMRVAQPTWLGAIGRRLTSVDADVRASDGLVSFSVMWAVALTFSAVSHRESLMLAHGLRIALIEYAVLASCVALILQPRRLSLLTVLAAAMALQYVFRLPGASTNQTIAFFMNVAIMTVVGVAWLKRGDVEATRAEIYERLRIVARLLLATMYFYGIFHKINVDFLDKDASCAVALYAPLTQMFGLEDNLLGRYGSIASTFIVEIIAIVCLFWKRYFAVGLIFGLVFHHIIPISAYSWYMDFSSLVFALYTLSVPREVSMVFYSRGRALLRRVPSPLTGGAALVGLGVVFVAATLLATLLRERAGDLVITDGMAWHSAWIVVWAVVGGVVMVLLTWAALEALPYRPVAAPRQPVWVYAIPAVLFVTCLSPYLGLKTESSIAMFSNVHTEGGTTNHLLFARPPYIAGYQTEVATIAASSNAWMQSMADRNLGMVRFQLERWMVDHPSDWVSFTLDGRRFEQATATSFPIRQANFFERRLLIFKPVDVSRPKMCTH